MRRQLLKFLSAATCIALLAACSGASTPTAEVASPVVTQESSREPPDSPQPTPTSAPSPLSESILPTPPAGDRSTVRGVFMRDLADGTSEPSADTKLQLARVIRSEEGTPLVASAGEKSSPTTVTQPDGTFTFTDVAPNTYALVVVTPLGAFMIEDEAGEDFLFDVEPGAVRDLGEVHTDLPY